VLPAEEREAVLDTVVTTAALPFTDRLNAGDIKRMPRTRLTATTP
jgi:hypothetical protein